MPGFMPQGPPGMARPMGPPTPGFGPPGGGPPMGPPGGGPPPMGNAGSAAPFPPMMPPGPPGSHAPPGARPGGAFPGPPGPFPGAPPPAPHGPPGAPGAPRAQGMQSRIDPSQIPRPVVSHQGPEPIIFHTRYNGAHQNPPPSTSRFIVRDCGGASPRLLRSTLNAVPHSPELLGSSGMPMAVVVQPLALPDPADDPVAVRREGEGQLSGGGIGGLFGLQQRSVREWLLCWESDSTRLTIQPQPNHQPNRQPHSQPPTAQVVDLGELGPIRCARCKAYINAFVRWTDGGKAFGCNFCGHVNP
jgi:hypothetical protein